MSAKVTTWRSNNVDHSAADARHLTWALASGHSAVVTPTDFAVAVATASGATHDLNVAPGSAIITCKSAHEAYSLTITDTTQLTLDDTGASSRSDLIVARINDEGNADGHGVSGQPAAAIEVIKDVPAGTIDTSGLAYAHPAIALARVDLPANTTAPTAAHIVPLARALHDRSLTVHHTAVTSAATTTWSNSGLSAVLADCAFTTTPPAWARAATITVSVDGLLCNAASGETHIEFGVGRGATAPTTLTDRKIPGVNNYTSVTATQRVTFNATAAGRPMTFKTRGQYKTTSAGSATSVQNCTTATFIVTFEVA